MSFMNKHLERLPPYMFARINQMKLELRQQGEDVIDLGMGNPDRPTPEHIRAKLQEVAADPKAHRYSASRGIPHLRRAICDWYAERFNVQLDPETEAIACIGSKEGISHLFISILDDGDGVLVPSPTYPSHFYAVLLAGGQLLTYPLTHENDFVPDLSKLMHNVYPRPKAVVLSYPNNPTAQVVDLAFFEEVVNFAKREDILVIHDNAYSEITFDGYDAPSFLQVPGAKDVGIEFYSLSKTYNMAGWRVGFCLGNPHVIAALAKLKSYYDYGIFTPIQVAAIAALRGPQECVAENNLVYRARRDVLVNGLREVGWEVDLPQATLYAWPKLPPNLARFGSLRASELLLQHAKVALSPGVGFGEHGEGYFRVALVENEKRIRQALRGIRTVMDMDLDELNAQTPTGAS